MAEVFISLGSNVNPERNLTKALRLLSEHIKILQVSTVYLTESIGTPSQPKYYNCTIRTETDIEPHALKFDILRAVEEKLGRRRCEDRFTPRIIDIDILVYGDLIIHTKDLTIPDQDILDRSFLALALKELKEDLVLPGLQKSIEEISKRFKDDKMTRLNEFTEALRDLVRTFQTGHSL